MFPMTIAQHATNILTAWKFDDPSGLGAALESASSAQSGQRPSSDLEHEQGEMLESIVEHLRQLASRNELPDPGKRNGAVTLLSHLSSSVSAQNIPINTNLQTLQEKL
jgi:hypothetical protein